MVMLVLTPSVVVLVVRLERCIDTGLSGTCFVYLLRSVHRHV